MIDLIRVAVREQGAFGVLLKDGYPFLVTIEHTYNDEDSIKIPEGKTMCHRSFFHRGGYKTFEVDVVGHSRILFHIANTEKDLDGCVGVGKSFGRLGGRYAILGSREGFTEFMKALEDVDSFELRVSRAGVTL